MERIYLIGFMGAGKTTVGRLLARKLGWSFVDLDEAIEQSEGRSVADIFKDSGETYFRDLETRELEAVSHRLHCVVALGGGTYVDPRNRTRIEETGLSVYLDTPLEIIRERIGEDGSRPLFANTRVTDLYRQRRPSYRMAAVSIDTRGLEPPEIADRVIRVLSPS